MTIDITKIVVALIGLLSAVITGFLIPWIRSKTGINNGQIEENTMTILRTVVTVAVQAAEQMYNSDQGKEKKAYVIQVLADQGYIADIEQIDEAMNSLIEAIVYELRLEQKK